MEKVVFSTVGNELEEFVDSLKCLHNAIRVRFYLKIRPYGCKLVVDATDKLAEKTFFNCLIKIRSVNEVEALRAILEGMRTSIEKFCQAQYRDSSSDTN